MEKKYNEIYANTGQVRRTVLITDEQAKEMNALEKTAVVYIYEPVKEKPEPESEAKKPGRPKA